MVRHVIAPPLYDADAAHGKHEFHYTHMNWFTDAMNRLKLRPFFAVVILY